MTGLIDTVVLNELFPNYTVVGPFGPDSRLSSLGEINVLVGSNNSGKSRLLRLLAANNWQQLPVVPRFDANTRFSGNISGRARDFSRHINDYLLQTRLTEKFGFITQQATACIDATKEDFGPSDQQRYIGFLHYLVALAKAKHGQGDPVEQRAWQNFDSSARGMLNELGEQLGKFGLNITRKRLYIPTLRSLRHITGSDEFMKRTKEQYFLRAAPDEIFTGQTLYADVENLVRGDLASREKLRRFEKFLSETFFQSEPIALIPRKDHSELTIKIGAEEERPIHQLGDGIQSLITVTFPLFRSGDEPLLAFIEEPEMFLHPWLQRVLLEVLEKKFPQHQYFLTTHSNHLLDLTLDIGDVSVFSFEKELAASDGAERAAHFRITRVSGDSRKPLELLGVRNSSVLLTNCTIWVEGITDRRYFAHWLFLYQQHLREHPTADPKLRTFREDLHFSFVEYGGGNITHWSFLDDVDDPIDVERLCGKLFLITDRDSEKAVKKSQRQEKLRKRLGERYTCLPCREIENILPPATLRAVLKSYGEDETAIPAVAHSRYKLRPIGNYIESVLLKGKKQREGRYAAKSGTVSDKLTFCRFAVEATKSWGDVSPEAQELVKRLYAFIESCNTD